MSWKERREQFRGILAGNRCIQPASVYDPISVRIAEDLGFEAGMFAGSVASLTVLGAPDLIVLTLSEFTQQAYRINRAANLPLLVDADHGYGNALNVKRTVEELEASGVAALTIEDTDLPYAHGSRGRTRLLSVAEGVGKMRAALAGRRDPALVIAGRTSAMSVHGLDETLRRVSAYIAVGVDAIFLTEVKTRDDLLAVSAQCSVPLFLGGTGEDMKDLEFLASAGVRISLYGHQPIMAAIQAVANTLQAIRDGTVPEELEGLASKDLMRRVTHDELYQQWIREFLEDEQSSD
jgi:carboxyvinyl-carboxyphosphonate phosphorylmutase